MAAVFGDNVVYAFGKKVGAKLFSREDSFWFHKRHLTSAEKFYEKHGGKTIILARFVPIIRTFAPFVAGVGRMRYQKFFSYNVIGGLLWVAIATFAGYFFGNIKFVKENFSLVIFGVIIISLLPIAIEIVVVNRFQNPLLQKHLLN